MRRTDRKRKRSNSCGRFVQLPHFLLHSAAWLSLTPNERIVYILVLQHYDGRNNGYIGLGARRAAALGKMNKDTASRCFRRLVEVGLLEVAQPSAFNQNDCQATEWRLTSHKCDRTGALPSRAYMRWTPDDLNTRPKRGTAASETKGRRRASEP